MKLLLDTTYFLPVIGIRVRDLSQDIIIKLINRGFKILVSEVTLFEMLAKGGKYVALGKLTPARVTIGIRALVHDERISKVPIYDTDVMLTAIKLRRVLTDFIDCIILSSAIHYADTLITEDEDIHDQITSNEIRKLIQEVNPEFTVGSIYEII